MLFVRSEADGIFGGGGVHAPAQMSDFIVHEFAESLARYLSRRRHASRLSETRPYFPVRGWRMQFCVQSGLQAPLDTDWCSRGHIRLARVRFCNIFGYEEKLKDATSAQSEK